MDRNNRILAAFSMNALVLILGMVGLALSLINQGIESFLFYTQDSNYFAMGVSLLYCVYAVKALRGTGKIPPWLHTLRYIAISCLMVTLFVVLFVLMPMMGAQAPSMLYEGSMLYQHTLCPLLAVFSFFCFEHEGKLPKSAMGKALIPPLVYAAITIVLNICKVIEGPYFFLMVYAQPWYLSVLWCMVVMGIAGFLAFIIWKLYNHVCTKTEVLQ